MPPNPEDGKRRVLIAGGGVAALEAMLALHASASGRVAVTLVAPDDEFVYRPLATGEPFKLGEVTRYPLARLTSEHGAELVRDRVRSVDPDLHVLHTYGGRELSYDTLIVALGLRRDLAFADALTFHDERDIPGYRELLAELRKGRIRSVGFLVPSGLVWPFPLYELAIMTADFATEHGLDVRLALVTPASAPLALFGAEAATAMSKLLTDRSIALYTGNQAQLTAPTRALLSPDGDMVHADRFVALPRLSGLRVAGLPHDVNGFIPTDDHSRVIGVSDVYAAGDCTTFPIKQGGLAAQQADVVAATIIAALDSAEVPAFGPVMRGILLTGQGPRGQGPRFLRTESIDGRSGGAVADHALWWPPTKIAGRYLAPCLGTIDVEKTLAELAAPDAVAVNLPLALSADHEEAGAKVTVAADGERQLFEFPPHGHGL